MNFERRGRGVIDSDLRAFSRMAEATAVNYDLPQGLAKVYHVKPPQHQMIDSIPVVLLEGFGVDEPRVRRMKAVVDAGRELLVPMRMDTSRVKEHPQMVDKYSLEDLKKARLLTELLRIQGESRYDLLANSGGSPTALLTAIEEPPLVRHIGLINPGINGPMKDLELSIRFVMKKTGIEGLDLRDPEVDPSSVQAVLEFFKHVLGNPVRALREIHGIAKTDTYALCEMVAKLGKQVFVICAKDDNIFPLEEIHTRMKKAGHTLANNPFAGFYEVDGRHDETSPLDPTRTKFALEILEQQH